jgi:branched-chain amino acid transport system ATP-binding protein
VPKGSIVTLLGTNGAGKTTTLRAISGLLKPENGYIRDGYIKFKGQEITNVLGTEIVKQGAVMVPEGRRVFKHLTVDENIRVGSITRKDGSAKIREDHGQMYAHFPRLARITNRLAGYCSGGEQQMIAIARALMAAPEMLMLDEPSLGLAPLLVREIFDKVKVINAELKTTILVVEQNAKIALEISDYAYIMESGKIVLEGPSQDLKDNPDVKEFYMGITQGGGRKSFKEVKSYKRRKRWM